jgi:hypothetical protein
MELKKLTAKEMAEFLFTKASKKPVIEFYAEYDEEIDETKGAYKASVIRYADSVIVLINYYGGGELFAYDITVDENEAKLLAELEKYFSTQSFGEFVWIENSFTDEWISINDEMPECFVLVKVKTDMRASGHNGALAIWAGSVWIGLKPNMRIPHVTHWQYVRDEE